MFSIYLAEDLFDLPLASAFVQTWQDLAVQNGFPGLKLYQVSS